MISFDIRVSLFYENKFFCCRFMGSSRNSVSGSRVSWSRDLEDLPWRRRKWARSLFHTQWCNLWNSSQWILSASAQKLGTEGFCAITYSDVFMMPFLFLLDCYSYLAHEAAWLRVWSKMGPQATHQLDHLCLSRVDSIKSSIVLALEAFELLILLYKLFQTAQRIPMYY